MSDNWEPAELLQVVGDIGEHMARLDAHLTEKYGTKWTGDYYVSEATVVIAGEVVGFVKLRDDIWWWVPAAKEGTDNE